MRKGPQTNIQSQEETLKWQHSECLIPLGLSPWLRHSSFAAPFWRRILPVLPLWSLNVAPLLHPLQFLYCRASLWWLSSARSSSTFAGCFPATPLMFLSHTKKAAGGVECHLSELKPQQNELSPLSDEQYGVYCGAGALSPGHHPVLTECFISFDSNRGPALVLSSSPGEGWEGWRRWGGCKSHCGSCHKREDAASPGAASESLISHKLHAGIIISAF